MADKKISQLTSASTPLAGTEVLPIVQNSATVKVSAADITAGRAVSMASGTLSSGNLTFSSTGQRLTGDMSNATVANRFAVQNSVTNGNTTWTILPNGTATTAQCFAYNNSDPTNASTMGFLVTSTTTRLQAGQTGTGAYLPISVYVNGANKWQFELAGNVTQQVASTGINFTANTGAAGMTSQLLNWYEEGTWTPAIIGSSTAGTGTYTLQEGSYTRIGRQVTVTAAITWTAHTGSGVLRVGGLPFTIKNDNVYAAFAMEYANLTVSANAIAVMCTRPGQTYLQVDETVAGGTGQSGVTLDTAASIYFSVTYFV